MSESLKASGFQTVTDLSARQYHAVLMSAAFTVATMTNGNAEIPFGVLQEGVLGTTAKPKGVELITHGQTKGKLGGTVTPAGVFLSVGNDGTFIAAPYETSPATADLYICGRALEAGVSGDIIQIDFFPGVKASTE